MSLLDIPSTADDVVLRDGSTLRLRPPVYADRTELVAFFARLSPESRYQRFHGARRVDAPVVEAFLDPNWTERGALVGTLADENGEERIVALASYARLREPQRAEVAFAVADELQRRGIGTRLLERLASRAAAAGIERFVAEVLTENRRMLTVFEHVGFEVKRELAGGEIEVEFPIAATAS
ncbi:MAG TPA: GNAT family N-acetyltransferase, partial [Gaiellaceae bacterium]|nr:GNAT family N-acetyltransferase [Gaiellaceae bacterium]